MRKFRRRYLVDMSVQGRLILVSVLCSFYAVLLVAFLTNQSTRELVEAFMVDPVASHDAIFVMVVRNSLLLMVVLVPSFWVLTLITSWRVAGPLYRIRAFLREVADGTRSEPCRVRKGDKLQDLCDLVNEVTETARAKAAVPGGAELEAGTKSVDAPPSNANANEPEEPAREVIHLG